MLELRKYLLSLSAILMTHAASGQPLYRGFLMPLPAGTYDFEMIYNFTRYLHSIHRYNSFVIYSHPQSRLRPKFILVRDFEQALVEDFNVPIIVWSNENNARLRNNIGLNNLVFVQFDGLSDAILDTVDLTLQGLHSISILFFYKNNIVPIPTSRKIYEFFEWCWQRNMLNVALTYHQIVKTNQTGKDPPVDIIHRFFNYSPFPKIKVNDMTEAVQRGGGAFMLDHIENVHGYEFHTPVTTALPYVFLQQTPANCDASAANCTTILSGTTGRLYTEFIRQINGSIKIEHFPYLPHEAYIEKLLLSAAKKQVHIGVHPFSRLSMSLNESMGSYPIGQNNACVIVPLIIEGNKAKYFQSPFQPSIWILIAFTTVALIMLQFALQYGYAAFSFGEALVSTASMMLDQAYVMEFVYKRSSIYKLLHVFILVMTFLLSNMYSASLTSFLSSVQLGKQIDSLQDFLASNLKILLTENEKRVYFDSARLPTVLLQANAKFTDRATVARHRDNLDTTYAYIVSADQWQMIDFKQKQLTKPLFRMPSKELCSATYPLYLPLQWNSPFDLSLALFFMATQETGLAAKWQDMSIAEAKRLKLLKIIVRKDEQWRPLHIKDYHLIAYLIGFLWLLACCACLAEQFYYKYRKGKHRKVSLPTVHGTKRHKSYLFKRGSGRKP